MHRSIVRLLSAMTLLVLTAQTSSAAPTDTFEGYFTYVEYAEEFTTASNALNLNVRRVYPAASNGHAAIFPVTIAELDLETAAGEIAHAGGLQFQAGETTVTLSQFVIDTQNASLTALAKANDTLIGRIDLFQIELPALTLPLKRNSIQQIYPAHVSLTADAAAALNSSFSVSAFAEGLSIGTAYVILGERLKHL